MVIQLYYLYKTSAFIAIKHVNILMHFTFYYNCLNLNSLKSDSIVYTAVEKPNFFFTQNKSCKLAQAYYFFFLIRKKKVYIFCLFLSHLYDICLRVYLTRSTF